MLQVRRQTRQQNTEKVTEVMGWTKTRARIAAQKRWHPETDVSELQRQYAKEVEEDRIRRLLARTELTDKQRRELAVLLLTKGPGDDLVSEVPTKNSS